MVTAIFMTSVLLGLVVIGQGQDCSKPVAGPNMNLKDSFILLDTFPDGSKVTFACATGYQTAGGSASITCTSGTWSPVNLICERKYCSPADEVTNGRVEYPEGNQFGDTLVVYCNEGHVMIGESRISCGDKGWLDRMPTCEVQTCEPPAALANGDYDPKTEEVYRFGNVITYSCVNGYVLNAPATAVCSDNGKFKPLDPPRCIFVGDVACKDPGRLANGERTAGFAGPYKYLNSVMFKCNPGYVMSGSDTITCGLDSNWSPEPPQCRPKSVSTTTKATTTTTTVHPKQTVSPPATTPSSHANHLKWAIPTVLGLIIVAVICLVVFKKKRGSQRGYSDKNASKDEGVALS